MLKIDRQKLFAFARVACVALVFALVLLAAADVVACPTCKDGIAESDPTSQAQARGYFYSILFMMAMPFVLLGTLGGAAYVSIRRAQERQVASQEGAQPSPGPSL